MKEYSIIDPEKVIDIIENKENIKLLEIQKYMIREYISKINKGRVPVCYELQNAAKGVEKDETISPSAESCRKA